MKKLIAILLLQLVVLAGASAQDKVVTGRVLDSIGGPVVGASVTEKGVSANGTATNASGRFTLTLRGTSNTVVISNIGFQRQEVEVATNRNPTVALVADNRGGLDDVVVVGFAKQKKVTLTGAVSTVSGAELRENPTASLQNTLAGRLPGFFSVQPTGRPGADGAQFFIRGQSSYNTGSNSPLIIVDDIEYTYEQFARLDPNEIESLSILKDASTTAIYGVKGANGVVVISTRRGKIGPPKIAARVETAMQQPSRIPRYLNAYESVSLYNKTQIDENLLLGQPANTGRRFSDADIELYRTGADPYGHPNVDWYETLFKNFSKQYRANFDISGGTDKVRYFISLGGLWQDGMLKDFSKSQDVNGNYYHHRYNYRSNLDVKITSTTDLRVDLYGNIGEVNVPNVGSAFGYNDVFYEYSSFYSLAPFSYQPYNPDGSFGYSNWQLNGGFNNAAYNTNNIVGRLTHYGYNRTYENNMNFIASANQKLDAITKGLSFKGTVAYISNYFYNRSMTRDQFPSFIASFDSAANGYKYTPRDPNVYRVRRFFSGYNPQYTFRDLNVQAMLNYDRTFGKHHVYGLALLSQKTTWRTGSAVYNFIPEKFRGITARIGYNFREKYLFELNAARNGSDRFSANNRFGLFPAVSAGWNIHRENFMANKFSFISNLKIRGSYGVVGNDKIGSAFTYYYLPVWSTGAGNINLGTNSNTFNGIREGALGNDEVTWEKEKKLDIGLDFSFFGGKLSGTVDYFKNQRYDILTSRGTVSAVFGQALPPVNLGIVDNEGYEIELTYNGKVGKDFGYRLKGTYSVAKNKIAFADEPTYANAYQAFTGNSIGQQRVYRWIGFYKDSADIAKSPVPSVKAYPGDLKYADLNKDGKIDGFDQEVTGYSNVPNTTYGFQVSFNYKGFSIGAFFQGARNFNVRAVAEAIRPFSANLQTVHTQAWTPELGDNAKFPRLYISRPSASDAQSYPSTFFFISGNYLRLKTAELSYTLPAALTKRFGLDAVRFYANGYNLLTWSAIDKLYEFDPEISTNSDRTIYPPQRTINFGTSITF